MPTSYFDYYFGIHTGTKPPISDSTLQIVYHEGNSDGTDVIIDFTQKETGWSLLAGGWAPSSSSLKTSFASNLMANGEDLRTAAFGNVTETWQCKLNFYSGNGLKDQKDLLEQILKVHAPAYFTNTRNHKPVYIKRKMLGESNAGYSLVVLGSVAVPQTAWDRVVTVQNGVLQPVLVTIIRTPFWLGAPPGQIQDTIDISATQDWNYDLAWAQETALPGGQVFCFVESSTGIIYAGGASEILKWESGAWAVVNTAPVALAADVTSAVLLSNDDILFGESGRVIKLSSGTWSVESTFPTGQVYALIQANDGQVYGGDTGQIIKRDLTDTWSADSTLPVGSVYSLLEADNGRMFAGEAGQIWQSADQSTIQSVNYDIITGNDDAEEFDDGTMALSSTDLDFFQVNYEYILLRFQAVAIPNSATIDSAIVRFKAQDNDTGSSGTIEIYCEDIDDSPQPTTTSTNISSRSLTTAYTEWSSEEDWIKNQLYDTPDFSSALQEVVNRGGWASGQDISVIFKRTASGNDRDAYSYDGAAGSPPELRVTFSEALTATWELSTTSPTGNVRSLLDTGSLVLAGEDGQILSTDSDGQTWKVATTTPTNEVRGLYDDGDNVWYGDNGNIGKSIDGGRNFSVDSTLPTGYIYDFIEETTTGDLRAGDNGRILILDASDTVTLGRDDTDKDEVFVANHWKTANITDIKVDDGGVYTDVFPMASFPTDLFPETSAANDACYFGIDTSLDDTSYYCSLIFDIDTPASSTTSYTIVWEYWNGAWVTLTTQDETNQLSEVGVKGVFWKHPSDWATTAVDGVTAYWVRARLSALVGTFTEPTQQNRDIYSVVWPCVELDKFQTKGNIDSLIYLEIHNRGDNGGPGGSEPQLYQNRIVGGIKETEGHTRFRSFINFADEQNPDGVTVDTSVDADSATTITGDPNLSGATGRVVFMAAATIDAGAGLNNLIDRVSIDFDTETAKDFYGVYKVFIRGYQSGGSAGEVTLRLKVVSGTGGISSLHDMQITQSTNDHELIEFSQTITLPVSSQFTSDDIGDTMSIVIQEAISANDADMYLYDIALIPVDRYWFDSEDKADTAESSCENGRRLVVDSISIPKAPTRSMVQKLVNNAWVSSWSLDSSGRAKLPAQKEQRLYILSARTKSAGSAEWISEPEVANSIKISKVDRWISGRGTA